MSLVLSLFPGIGLLDRAFEEEGFCVVRGPDLLWGGEIEAFHPPAGKFDGVIGGPPCQRWSRLQQINIAQGRPLPPDLIPEFTRVVEEAAPSWFVMENVVEAPVPEVHGYHVDEQIIDNNHCGGIQRRKRRWCFGTVDGRSLHVVLPALYPPDPVPTVTRRVTKWENRPGKRSRPHSSISWANLRKSLEFQGLPSDFLDNSPFTLEGASGVIGNGVPLPMGRAVAKAVKESICLRVG